MPTDLGNPYTPPNLLSDDYARRKNWHLFPAVASLLIGAVSFGVGVFAVAVMIYVLRTDQANATADNMMAACTLYIGFGTCWIIAGWSYLKRRYRRALIANVLGLLFPLVLFTIFGF